MDKYAVVTKTELRLLRVFVRLYWCLMYMRA